MQPHSMCAVAVANYVWNAHEKITATNYEVKVEYIHRRGEFKTNIYRLSGFKEESDRKAFSVYIIRAGGGIACTIYARRNSTQEGSKIEMTHSQNHTSGLREEYELWKKNIKYGRHYNSSLYRDFEGESITDDRKRINFNCDVKQIDNKTFKKVNYEITIREL